MKIFKYVPKKVRREIIKSKQMSFAQKLMPSFFHKEDPVRKQLKKVHLYTDELNQKVLLKSMELFHNYIKQQLEQQMIKSLMKLMQQKTTYARKLKLLFYIIQITKQTKYDIADILVNKKLKIFTKSSTKIKLIPILDKSSLQHHIYADLMMPLYNYMMKLSVNEELFNTCRTKEIPDDEIFRRGMKIRFIWIFKIYNLIHILIPVMQSLQNFIKVFPSLEFFKEMAGFLFEDIVIMNNFILKAIEEASNDNYILMPYFDMLQFYESLTEQIQTSKKVMHIYTMLKVFIPNLQKPQELKLSMEEIQEIQVQALRVKLISNSLKNPKKDHTRLQTEYNVKAGKRQKIQKEKAALTEGNQQGEQTEDIESWKEKFRNLDIKQKFNLSMQQVSDEDEDDPNESR